MVTAIAAPASLRITIEGEGGHAGAVLMPDRRDAFLAAAEIALAIERAAKSTGAIDTVGTVGVCDVFPGAVNSIPSRVKLEIDVRDIDLARRDSVLAAILGACEEVGARRHVRVNPELINKDAPMQSSPPVVEALRRACEAAGFAFTPMVSRAYHDSLFMSAHRAGGDALHPLPERRQPSSRRVRRAGRHRARKPRSGPCACGSVGPLSLFAARGRPAGAGRGGGRRSLTCVRP